MKKQTRARWKEYTARIAELNALADASDVTSTFSVEPTVQQKLEEATQESSEFLSQINIVPVDEQEGEALGLIVSGPIASRTDTSGGKKRGTVDPTGLKSNRYACKKTNSDTHITYAKLDAWAKFPDFQTRIRDVIVKRQGLDRIMIGWNGKTVADNTDKAAHPLLEDVNVGWLEKIRQNAPERHLAKGDIDAGHIYVGDGVLGTGVDFQNLDALATDAMQLLDPWAREDPGLVVICGSDLMHDKYFPIINKAGDTATEIVARDQILRSAKQLGGKPAISVPYFPANAMLVTTLENLSIYWQDGTRRRHIIEVPDEDCIKNFESWNEAYVVEDYGLSAFVENIVMGKKA
jgi:P2 family phage major capsid protein